MIPSLVISLRFSAWSKGNDFAKTANLIFVVIHCHSVLFVFNYRTDAQ